jgi:DNA (cytosine-5)-methyltransferase 1
LHASPDCRHFSKAKGAAPNRDEKIRDLPWTIVKWAREVRPNIITMENVEEIISWGPLDASGVPIKARAGETWKRFLKALRAEGYAVQHQELRACDYGAPTIRKRLFLIARRDGRPIVWPKPTHGNPASKAVQSGKLLPWRTAAECIDWRHPCPSIFERKRPLAEATLHRIAEGIERYVIQSARPFIVGIDNAGARSAKWAVDQPLSTVITKAKHGLVSPFLAKHYGGVVGQELGQPIGTVTTVDHHSLVAVHVQRDFSQSVGHAADEPLGTVTAGGGGKSGVVTSHLVKLRGTCKDGQPVNEPMPTITSGGTHLGEVRAACLIKYYGQGGGQPVNAPAATVTTKDRMAVVEARPSGNHAAEVRALLRWHRQSKAAKAWGWRLDDFAGLLADAFAGEVILGGELYIISDIGLRMLQPRELYRAQGFPDSYIIGDDPRQGLSLTKAEQVHMCGNSVPPDVEAAIVAANYTEDFVQAREARVMPLLGVGRG